jgi:hypothetical protein
MHECLPPYSTPHDELTWQNLRARYPPRQTGQVREIVECSIALDLRSIFCRGEAV